ncbi:putative metal transport system membrane protein TP [Clostridium pasteurianum DSM 525 = ATCC 6013]|uniref:ABC-type transporter, integral membrane subunit n=1 Tax=Clostridium pasteurianum DSM 525 = ATCC 6013 TaxID=1262449 RepID=A0A0H3J8T5_CLOPA|nr:metal ABC transporter permease [Clostridium pasteurianum]AJA49632.1 putative metal transport system membrane protein TP [Clostridium pasteurianum DSM 525 = ATCC 6013]AJA53620.1 putative metal transport system membrane protein TP [Clostridium pasteurianum DSM 525 = ATCC 6013]AOZ76785.1 metal ABC transporter permease [Clostridium pasteurianum DSM 525 = ATCC 6013]AOZ80582.1 metal ABC transporter permease [Clostridium pasteurianum]ELP58852.1 ABC-type iron (III) transport system, permease compon
MLEVFHLSFMRNAFMAALLISILCPSIGIFLVLKRYAMVGDTLAHASFAGVAIGLVFGQSPIIYAFIFTSICAVLIEFLKNYYKQYSDLILPIILTLSVGVAITLTSSGKAHGNIESFLFGSILTVEKTDLYTILILSIVCVITLKILYEKLLYVTFDEEGAKIANINVKFINYIFAILVGASISVSIRIIGILVVSSMVAVPVATAIQLNKSFKKTFIYSIIFALVDIILGLILSYYLNCAPGGTIALTSVLVLIIIIISKTFIRN